jgi:hypothetical protein
LYDTIGKQLSKTAQEQLITPPNNTHKFYRQIQEQSVGILLLENEVSQGFQQIEGLLNKIETESNTPHRKIIAGFEDYKTKILQILEAVINCNPISNQNT